MKFYFRSLRFIFIIFLIFSCTKDEEESITQVQTVSFSFLPEGGVELKGRTSNVSSEINYGFVVSRSPNPTYEYAEFKIQHSGLFNGEYRNEITSGLISGQRYYFKAFIYSNSVFTYGEEKTFSSNGSTPPVISEVIPDKGHFMDTITLKGSFFSKGASVLFNERACTVLSNTGSELSCIVPANFLPGEVLEGITVINNTGEKTLFTGFSFYQPVIDSIAPGKAYESDTLVFYGNHFDIEKTRNNLIMEVEGEPMTMQILESSRTQLKVKNSRGYYQLFPKFVLWAQTHTVVSENQLQLALPEITQTPECINSREDFTIYGKNFPKRENAPREIHIGDVKFNIKYMYRDSIVIQGGAYSISTPSLNNLYYSYAGNNIIVEKEFCIADPWLTLSFQNAYPTHLYDGSIYGLTEINYQYTVGRFNPETNKFTSVNGSSIPSEVSRSSLNTFHQDKLYNYYADPYSEQTRFLSYNLLTDQVQLLRPFPGGRRQNGFMVTVGDHIYLGLGAMLTSDYFQDIWKYSIANDTWEKVIDFTAVQSREDARTRPLTFVHDNTIYFGGGHGGSNEDLWAFDTATNTITPRAALPKVLRGVQKATVMGGKAYYEDYHLFEYDILQDQWKIYSEVIKPDYFSGGEAQGIFNLNGDLYRSINSSSVPFNRVLYKLNPRILNP